MANQTIDFLGYPVNNKFTMYTICDRFWENRPKRGKQFFSVSLGKALWLIVIFSHITEHT